MRVAALSDVHGNLPALEAVLADVAREQPDLIVFCGDIVSGPMPGETAELAETVQGARFVRGNADRGVIEAFDRSAPSPMPGPLSGYCAGRISQRHRDFLGGFEPTVSIDGIDGIGRVLFCHASPRNDVDVFTAESSDERIRTLMSGVDADVVVCGHTHMQFDRTVGRLRIVNPGSVGMPYGRPGAYWAMLGPGVSLRRTDYDREAAAERMVSSGGPEAEQFVRENVLSVPTVEQAMDFMRQAEAQQA